MSSVTPNTAVLETGPVAVPSLRSNFKWTFAGNVIYSACQWGMLSALAKLGNSSVVGEFALGLAIAAPIYMLTNLQLRAVQATDARSDFRFADYFTVRLIASALGLAVVSFIAFSLQYDLATRAVVFFIGLAKAVESLSDVVAGLLQKVERLDQVAISLMIRGVLSVSGFGGVFAFAHSLVLSTLVLAVVWVVVFLAYDLRRAKRAMGEESEFLAENGGKLRKLVVVSVPLGIVMALISLNTNLPRYILVKFLGPSDLGIFASLAYMLVAVSLIVNALGQSASARLARAFADRNLVSFRRLIQKLCKLSLCVLVIGVPAAAVAGRPLLTVVYRPEYGARVGVFVIMVVTAGIASIGNFLGYGMTAARSFRMQVPIMVAATGTTGLLSILLVPRYGLIGAALALLVSAFILTVGSALVLRNALKSEALRGAEC